MDADQNKKKRKLEWRIVISVSSALIIIILSFFLYRIFRSNPLEGSWCYEDSNLTLTVKNDGEAEIQWPEIFDGKDIKVPMHYLLEKDSKSFALSIEDSTIKSVAKKLDGAVTEDELRSAISTLTWSYFYSLEGDQLILTEKEYGDQLIFDRK